MFQVNPLQALFSLKDKSKKLKCCLLQFLIGALRVKPVGMKKGFDNKYRISWVIRQIIFLPKQSQRSRSVLKDGSRSLGLF